MRNSKHIKLLFLVFIWSHFSNAYAQSVYMIVEDTAPIYKTIQRYEDVPFTEMKVSLEICVCRQIRSYGQPL